MELLSHKESIEDTEDGEPKIATSSAKRRQLMGTDGEEVRSEGEGTQ